MLFGASIFFMKFILGTKQNMTQIFNDEGVVSAATIIDATPLAVTQQKTEEKDGYIATQVGFGPKKEKNVNKAQRPKGNFSMFKEFKAGEEFKAGDTIDVSSFEVGDVVNVSAVSKGKGFQGGVKRYNFKGGPRTHGNKHQERKPGSIGATGPQRVFKGTRMAGRMGADRVTVKNLTVLGVDVENNRLLVSGAVPGRKGTIVEIRTTSSSNAQNK